MIKYVRFHIRACALISVLCALFLCACAKNDPILPGDRSPVFSTGAPVVENKAVPADRLAVPESRAADETRKFEQTQSNEIWEVPDAGEKRKIFAGLATAAYIDQARAPVFADGFVYAGLSTGEVIKVNPKNRQLAWVADVYKTSLMTGGAGLLDIVAPVVVSDKFVYAGGLGDAFCKLNAGRGDAVWCVWIGVGMPFVLAGEILFVSATDDYLYAIDAKTGEIYWRVKTKTQGVPKLTENNGKFIISVGKQKFDAETGKINN